MTPSLPTPGLEHVLDVAVELGELIDHGHTRAGHRRVIPIVGGRIVGRGPFASLLGTAAIDCGGADWQIVRPDGSIEIDARYTARAPDGSLVYLRTSGIRAGTPHVMAALGRGETVSPAEYYFRILVTFETSSVALRELEHGLFIASGARDAAEVKHRVYRVT